MRRTFCMVFLLLFCSACSHRYISDEVAALHTRPALPSFPVSKKGPLIVVDAGHGGKDPGTCSKRDDYEEKTLTLMTARMLCTQLHKLGYRAILTRNQDVFLDLSVRADIANAAHADLFVSVHYNHCPSEQAEGVEVYYYREGKTPPTARIAASKKLSQDVLKKVTESTHAFSRGTKEGNFAVIRETHMPAILVEAGFLSNPKERKALRDPRYVESVARGIASGIDTFLHSH